MKIYKLQLIRCKNEKEVATKLAKQVIELIKHKPNASLVLSTGQSPVLTYAELIKDHKKNKTDWSKVRTFNLDEYVTISPKYSRQGYRAFMEDHLFYGINIAKANTYFPDKNCLNGGYEKQIEKAGGADIAIVGLGVNGHIAFNEPGSPIDSLTRVVQLAQQTREVHAKKFFDNDVNNVPKEAYSMGIKSILNAKQIILLGVSPNKTNTIRTLFSAKGFETKCPCTALLTHPNVIAYVDEVNMPEELK